MSDNSIHQESLVSSAASAIRRILLSGKLEMGSKVAEESLAAQLGISRPPLREALRLIHGEGLLEHTPRRGYNVPVVTQKSIREILDLREALELHALSVISHPDATLNLANLETVLSRMKEHANVGDSLEVISSITDFHTEVINLAGNSRLSTYYRQLLLQLQLWLATSASREDSSSNVQEMYEQHVELHMLIVEQRWDEAKSAFVAHGTLESLQGSAIRINVSL